MPTRRAGDRRPRVAAGASSIRARRSRCSPAGRAGVGVPAHVAACVPAWVPRAFPLRPPSSLILGSRLWVASGLDAQPNRGGTHFGEATPAVSRNGPPEESLTCHQPGQQAREADRGRTCNTPRPPAPRSAFATRRTGAFRSRAASARAHAGRSPGAAPRGGHCSSPSPLPGQAVRSFARSRLGSDSRPGRAREPAPPPRGHRPPVSGTARERVRTAGPRARDLRAARGAPPAAGPLQHRSSPILVLRANVQIDHERHLLGAARV